MRKTLIITIASLAFTATGALAQSATVKLAFINSQKLIAEAPGAAEARTTIEREVNKHRADLALAEDSLKTVVTDFQKKQLALSKEARDREEANIRTRQVALQQRAEQLEDQVAKRQNDLVKPIMDRINAVLDTLRKEGGYAIIFDVAGGSIVAADPAADLTDQVLTRLKSMAAAQTTAPKNP
jgi:outer membrane protein